MDGFFVVDKPAGVSSAWVVGKVKWKLKQALGSKVKVGHGGTLDPFATGVLPLGIGKGTKGLQALLEGDKAYEFTVQFGRATTTGDPEGEVLAESAVRPGREEIEGILDLFCGDILQTPPAYSALKVDGKRAYKLARAGEAVELAPRRVHVRALTLVDVVCCRGTEMGAPVQETCADPSANRDDQDKVHHAVFVAVVSKGTYIRVLGEDIAKALGTVGHLSTLRRTLHGGLGIERAITWDMLDKALDMGDWEQHLLPLDACPAAANGAQA